MPDTCENWLGRVTYVYYAGQTHEIYHVLSYSVDFKVLGELWNLLSKTVLSKSTCSFIWNKGSVNIWNDREAQTLLAQRTCKYFL